MHQQLLVNTMHHQLLTLLCLAFCCMTDQMHERLAAFLDLNMV